MFMDQLKQKEPGLDLANALNLENRYQTRRNQMKETEMIAIAQDNHSKTQQMRVIDNAATEGEVTIIKLPTWVVLLFGIAVGVLIGILVSLSMDLPTSMF